MFTQTWGPDGEDRISNVNGSRHVAWSALERANQDLIDELRGLEAELEEIIFTVLAKDRQGVAVDRVNHSRPPSLSAIEKG
jgi:hypothetical protein